MWIFYGSKIILLILYTRRKRMVVPFIVIGKIIKIERVLTKRCKPSIMQTNWCSAYAGGTR